MRYYAVLGMADGAGLQPLSAIPGVSVVRLGNHEHNHILLDHPELTVDVLAIPARRGVDLKEQSSGATGAWDIFILVADGGAHKPLSALVRHLRKNALLGVSMGPLSLTHSLEVKPWLASALKNGSQWVFPMVDGDDRESVRAWDYRPLPDEIESDLEWTPPTVGLAGEADVSLNTTISEDTTIDVLSVANGGLITITNGATLTVGRVVNGRERVFAFQQGTVKILSSPVYPEWFGAKADGSHDDAAAIERAMESIGRGTVSLDSRSYGVSGVELLGTNASLVGNGSEIRKISANGQPTLKLEYAAQGGMLFNPRFAGFRITGAGAGDGPGILLLDTSTVVLEDVVVQGTGGHCVKIGELGSLAQCHFNTFNRLILERPADGAPSIGVYGICNGNTFNDCVLMGVGPSAPTASTVEILYDPAVGPAQDAYPMATKFSGTRVEWVCVATSGSIFHQELGQQTVFEDVAFWDVEWDGDSADTCYVRLKGSTRTTPPLRGRHVWRGELPVIPAADGAPALGYGIILDNCHLCEIGGPSRSGGWGGGAGSHNVLVGAGSRYNRINVWTSDGPGQTSSVVDNGIGTVLGETAGESTIASPIARRVP